MLALVSGVSVVACAAMPAAAQDPAPAAVTAKACELHVWPGSAPASMRAKGFDNFQSGLKNSGNGGLIGGSLDQAMASRAPVSLDTNDTFASARSVPMPARILDAPRQIALLETADLPHLFGLEGYTAIFHDEVRGLADARQPGRLAQNEAGCSAELILADLTYARVYAHGHNLKALLVLREFASGPAATRRYSAPVETSLTVPAYPDDRSDAAFIADLETAFMANVRQFALQIAKLP